MKERRKNWNKRKKMGDGDWDMKMCEIMREIDSVKEELKWKEENKIKRKKEKRKKKKCSRKEEIRGKQRYPNERE